MKMIISLFLLFILSSCNSLFISEVVTRSGQPLYQDDFSNPKSGWTQTVNEHGSLGYSDGAYRMLVQSPGFDLWAVSGQAFKDVQIEVDATRLAGPLSNRFGLVCRFKDSANFYMFIISSDGYYAIGKLKNGTASLLGQEMMASNQYILQGNATNHLRFDCIGNTLRGSVNDQLIAITSDNDYSNGDAGLITGTFDESGVEVSFDDFRVIKP
jgi:hypothetical protein